MIQINSGQRIWKKPRKLMSEYLLQISINLKWSKSGSTKSSMMKPWWNKLSDLRHVQPPVTKHLKNTSVKMRINYSFINYIKIYDEMTLCQSIKLDYLRTSMKWKAIDISIIRSYNNTIQKKPRRIFAGFFCKLYIITYFLLARIPKNLTLIAGNIGQQFRVTSHELREN